MSPPGPDPDFERIEPAPLEPGRARPADAAAERGLGRGWWIALGALVAALLLVLFWLPSTVAPTAVAVATPPPAATAPEPTPPASVDVDALLASRAEAEGLLATLRERVAQVESRAVARWNEPAGHALAEAAAAASARFEERSFAEASTAARTATADADRLLEESRTTLTRALADGEQALGAGDASGAAHAFELALAIEPANAVAKRGAARAAAAPSVRERLASARRREEAGDLEGARRDLRAALELDPEATEARTTLARLDAAATDGVFRRHMSNGLAALGRGDAGAARAAFDQAAAVRPGSPEAADGLARAQAVLQSRGAAALQARAAELEAGERWDEALAVHEEALALDPTLAFARAGKERTAARAALGKRLATLLAAPAGLASKDVQKEAEAAVAETSRLDPASPALGAQSARLAEALRLARLPIAVELVSDEETDVVVYKVGDLGRFRSRQVELTPGAYTVVGRRTGHRDVRLEIRIAPGDTSVPPVVVRCEEAL